MRKNVTNIFNETLNAYILKRFPLDQNNSLPYHYTVLSAVVNITIDTEAQENLTSYATL